MKHKLEDPSTDPVDYVACLGKHCKEFWPWHAAPAESSSRATLLSYSLATASALKRWFVTPERISVLRSIDDDVGWTETARSFLMECSVMHGGGKTLMQACDDVRSHLIQTLKGDCLQVSERNPLFGRKKSEEIVGAKEKIVSYSPKYKNLIREVTKEGVLESFLKDVLPSALSTPPSAAIVPYMLDLRKDIRRALHNIEELTIADRDNIVSMILDAWDAHVPYDLYEKTQELCKKHGFGDVDDNPAVTAEAILAAAKNLKCSAELEQEYTTIVTQFLFFLCAERSRDNDVLFKKCGEQWMKILCRNLNVPHCMRPDFNLAYLACMVRENTKEEIDSHLGVF